MACGTDDFVVEVHLLCIVFGIGELLNIFDFVPVLFFLLNTGLILKMTFASNFRIFSGDSLLSAKYATEISDDLATVLCRFKVTPFSFLILRRVQTTESILELEAHLLLKVLSRHRQNL